MRATKRNSPLHSNRAAADSLAVETVVGEVVSTSAIAETNRVNDKAAHTKKDAGLRGPFDFLFTNVAAAILWAVIGLIIFRLIA